MAISTDCFTVALAPLMTIEDLLNPQRLLAKAAASRFNLRGLVESPVFNDWWKLSKPARDAIKCGPGAHLNLETETLAALGRLAGILNGIEYTERGYRLIRRMPGIGRFVIFSDHHMAPSMNRQAFFLTSGNSDLYAEDPHRVR